MTELTLRTPFEPAQIGKLPRLTCRDCSQSTGKVCGKHSKSKCAECGNYISGAHIHLDYVGHAAVTDRLLHVDEGWTWEPLARDSNGAPILINDPKALMPEESVGLWIALTVSGITRPGFGGGKNVKEAIGDAIRNAAMRFGVALDLWSKEDLHAEDSGAGAGASGGPVEATGQPAPTNSYANKVPKQKAPASRKAPTPEEVAAVIAGGQSIIASGAWKPEALQKSAKATKPWPDFVADLDPETFWDFAGKVERRLTNAREAA